MPSGTDAVRGQGHAHRLRPVHHRLLIGRVRCCVPRPRRHPRPVRRGSDYLWGHYGRGLVRHATRMGIRPGRTRPRDELVGHIEAILAAELRPRAGVHARAPSRSSRTPTRATPSGWYRRSQPRPMLAALRHPSDARTVDLVRVPSTMPRSHHAAMDTPTAGTAPPATYRAIPAHRGGALAVDLRHRRLPGPGAALVQLGRDGHPGGQQAACREGRRTCAPTRG